MKARIRKTGEIVDVIRFTSPLGTHRCSDDSVCYIDSKGREQVNPIWDIEDIKEKEIPVKETDWEHRRYEIAKECVAVLIRNEITLEDAAKISVEQADALIKELKKVVEI